MDLRGFRLRTIGPPFAVAAACVTALVWFDKAWIPAQQQYLNGRNLRTLRTIAAQIKAKVDNFDLALDHAIDSVRIQDGDGELLQKYVKLFSPELEVVTLDSKHPAWKKVTAGDPPNVRIQRDEGHNYLYLGYRHEAEHRKGLLPVSLIARGDIEQVAAQYLTRNDFDALLLLDGQGATIAQQSSSGLELTSVDTLRDRGQSAASGTQPKVFERLRGTTDLAVVTIGAADYMVYAQPVPLSLMHEGKDATQAPEEWTLCGLVRLDRFRATSSTIPTTYWLLFGAVLAIVCFAIPLVKLRVLSPRERLRRVDGVSAAAAVFMMMALATFIALDLHMFGVVIPAAVDAQLQAVAASISMHVHQETEAIARQIDAFERKELWQQKLGYTQEVEHSLDEIRAHLTPDDGADIKLGSDGGSRSPCAPSWSCRSGVLRDLGGIDYPFFQLMVWSDNAGWQRIKWSTSRFVTPFINVDEAKLAYSNSLKLARRLGWSDPSIPTMGVTVMLSPNTGEKLTLFWKALPPSDEVRRDPTRTDLLGETLATTPVSLTSPVLPKYVQFAVVDRAGRVLFHSDASRSLAENFFQESEENPKLKSLVAGRESGVLGGRYLGRSHRFHVTPLDMAPFGDPRWSLIVFQDAAVGETANLGTLNLTASMFVVYAAAVAAIWMLVGALWPNQVAKWLWPVAAKGVLYRRAALVGTASGLACCVAPALLESTALLSTTAVLIASAVATMFAIVRAEARQESSSPAWLANFFWARASLVFLLAAVPAMVCFQVAYAFHAELVVKRGQSHVASELGARARRINGQAQRVAICTVTDPGSQPCAEVSPFVTRRTMHTLWDVDVPAVRTAGEDRAAHGGYAFAPPVLRAFLLRVYRPYNDVAADLLMTPASRPDRGLERWRLAVDSDGTRRFTNVDSGWTFVASVTPPFPMSGVSWLIAASLMGVAYALVRYLLQPIFALHLNPPTALLEATGAAEDTSLLVVGPPGSRRTERLLRHPRVCIFDVRSLSFIDQPIAVVPVSPVQVSSAADCGHATDDPEVDWTDAIHAATSHPLTIVAIDHLEHRLGDYTFRRRMLECLESAVYGRGATIWCGADRDPIQILDELDPPPPDRRRWARVFEGFRRERLGLDIDHRRASALDDLLRARCDRLTPAVRSLIVTECRVAPELLAIGEQLACRLPLDASLAAAAVLDEIGRAAEPFYAALWSSCSTDDRVVLRQLAEEHLVNPNNAAAVARMLSAGLVRRHTSFHIMNETFRRFVIAAASPQVVSTWEHEGVRVPWGTIATTGVTVAFGLAGLLLLTQEQLVDAWISYVPAFAPAIPTVWKVLASVQKGRIEVTA